MRSILNNPSPRGLAPCTSERLMLKLDDTNNSPISLFLSVCPINAHLSTCLFSVSFLQTRDRKNTSSLALIPVCSQALKEACSYPLCSQQQRQCIYLFSSFSFVLAVLYPANKLLKGPRSNSRAGRQGFIYEVQEMDLSTSLQQAQPLAQ